MTPSEQLLYGAITVLSGIVAHLYWRIVAGEKRLMEKLDACEKKHEECEKDRASIWRLIATHNERTDTAPIRT